MKVEKSFKVFGEPVEINVSSKSTDGAFCILTQTSEPGGGPPPHVHSNEEEIFSVMEGEYELFDGKGWTRLPMGDVAYRLRGQPHTFRNCGATTGKLRFICTPGGLDEYLEKISVLSIPQDMDKLTEISDAHGIKFLTPEPVESAPV